ncbi:MAG: hypothetical protein JNJ61_10035 [Anaerolineae bacterium]|nr:hypothetical protein [Anaerolineae bacterium]
MVGKPKPRSATARWWPVIGLVLVIAVGFLSWVIAPEANRFLARTLPNYPPPGVTGQTLNLIMTGILFVIVVLLVSLVVAASAPKKKSVVNEPQLMKDRAKLLDEKKKQKLRQRQINRMNKSQ